MKASVISVISVDIPMMILWQTVMSSPPCLEDVNATSAVPHCFPSVVVPSLLLVQQSGIYRITVCTNRPVPMESENPPVCLLLAFH